MPAELAEHVDKVLGTDGFFRRRCEDERRGHARYFERVLEAEKHAKSIEEWCPMLIPGLLQAEACARAVTRSAHPLAPDEEVEEQVSARLMRAQLFEDNHKTPEFGVILLESFRGLRAAPAHAGHGHGHDLLRCATSDLYGGPVQR